MLFQIRNLKKIYGQRTVLDITDLEFEKGVIYALLGPNGSGKTTLLEILGLLLSPTSGEIRYENRIVNTNKNHLFALRREVIMVHQNPVLFSTSIYKNLEFCLKIRGVPKGDRDGMIRESLDLVGLGSFVHADARNLSGGETQRAAIARALACSPKAVFFDEPTANVDVENQNAIEQIIRDINAQKGITIIFTSHDMVQASRLSQRVISLFEGRKVPATFENLFTGNVVERKNGLKICHIHDRVVLSIRQDILGPVRLSIDPLKVRLHVDRKTPTRINIFRGRLVQLTDENDFIRAVVDIGIPLNLLLLKSQVPLGPLSIGEDIDVSCPPDAIYVF